MDTQLMSNILIIIDYSKRSNKKSNKKTGFAEREGFEPSIPFRGIHAFQACQFNHSCTSPEGAVFKAHK
jgi:hypothetical protein